MKALRLAQHSRAAREKALSVPAITGRHVFALAILPLKIL
jgi:hypothetical protein